jgi:hypothetical protein
VAVIIESSPNNNYLTSFNYVCDHHRLTLCTALLYTKKSKAGKIYMENPSSNKVGVMSLVLFILAPYTYDDDFRRLIDTNRRRVNWQCGLAEKMKIN